MRTLTSLLLLLAATLFVPRLSDAEVLRVTIENVSLRNQPTTSGSVVATVTRGMLLDLVERQGYWNKVRVRFTGAVGYVHSAFVELDAEQTLDTSPPVRNPAPPPSPPPPAPERTSGERTQTRQSESGNRDVGPLGVGGYLWSSAGVVALSPLLDFSEHFSFLGTLEITNPLGGYRSYDLTGNLLFRFPVRGSSLPVTFEPYVGGGIAIFSLTDSNTKGLTILGGTFVRFESLPHFKFSAGLMHTEILSDDFGLGLGSSYYGGPILMVGGHYFF